VVIQALKVADHMVEVAVVLVRTDYTVQEFAVNMAVAVLFVLFGATVVHSHQQIPVTYNHNY
jgi:rRNA maturation endonuclease Nob1